MVWKAYSKSEGGGNNLFSVFPHMALTLRNSIGVTKDNARSNYPTVFWATEIFKRGLYTDGKRTYVPYIESGWKITSLAMGKDDFTIWQFRKEPDFTRVIFMITWDNDYDNIFMFFKNTYLKYNNQKYMCRNAFYIDEQYGRKTGDAKIGKRNYVKVKPNERREVWVCVDFDPLPEDATLVDLISQKNNNSSKHDMVWKGIHLRNK